MAVEGVMLRDGNTVAAANYYNPSSALDGPNGSGQFLAVKLSTAADNTSLLATSGGEMIFGILQNTPVQGDSCDVAIIGETKAVAGAAVTRGDLLMTDTAGRLITATATNHVIGQAKESAAAANVVFAVDLFKGGYIHA